MIGFGTHEQQYEAMVESELLTTILNAMKADHAAEYFSDGLIASVSNVISAMAQTSRDEAESYRKATDHPERYGSFHVYVLGDCNYIVCVMSFSHINRRHAFSPDGWAMMQTRPVFAFRHQDMKPKISKAA